MPPSALPQLYGSLQPSMGLILTLNYTATFWLDPGPASSPWHCLMAWTLAGPGDHLGVCPACLVSPGTSTHWLSCREQLCSYCSLATSKQNQVKGSLKPSNITLHSSYLPSTHLLTHLAERARFCGGRPVPPYIPYAVANETSYHWGGDKTLSTSTLVSIFAKLNCLLPLISLIRET